MTNYAKIIAWKQAERSRLAELVASRPKRKVRRPGRGPNGGRKQRRYEKKGRRRKPVVHTIVKINSKGYPSQWTKELRESIRLRQGYRCRWCGALQADTQESLHVHHRNMEKRDCRPANLVALCHDCHTLLAHHGKHSPITGVQLELAIERQRAKKEAWKAATAAERQERFIIDAERDEEARARELGLTPER